VEVKSELYVPGRKFWRPKHASAQIFCLAHATRNIFVHGRSDNFMPFSKHKIATKGQEIYNQKLQEKLEPECQGQIVAIEIDSEDYFLGTSVVKALKKAKKKYPDKLFYLVRVGFPAVHKRRW